MLRNPLYNTKITHLEVLKVPTHDIKLCYFVWGTHMVEIDLSVGMSFNNAVIFLWVQAYAESASGV
jgi:hypothetical protein